MNVTFSGGPNPPRKTRLRKRLVKTAQAVVGTAAICGGLLAGMQGGANALVAAL